MVVVAVFEGSLFGLDRIWQMFTREWLPASGYQFRLSHVYDMYPVELFSGSLLRNIVRSLNGIQSTLCIPISRDWIGDRPAINQPKQHNSTNTVASSLVE